MSNQPPFRTNYTYDVKDQLTAASSTQIVGMPLPFPLPASESYNLDPNGNRRSSGGASQSAAGTHNRLQTDGTFNYTYDNEGNTTRRTRIVGGQVTDYSWDHRNRLTSVIDCVSAAGAKTQQVEYIYDAFDQLTGKRVATQFDATGIVTNWSRYELFAWANGQEVFRFVDSDGQGTAQPARIANRYLSGAAVDQLLADEQYPIGTGPAVTATTASAVEGNTLWALTDHLGSVRDLVDNNGVIREHNVYDSFGRLVREVDYNAAGQVIASTDPAAVDTLFGYTGRLFDPHTGLQYNRARWYDANTGRWLSQDPIGFAAGDVNLYRYVGNGATNKTDPSGLQPPDSVMDRRLGINRDYYERRANRVAAQRAYNASMDTYNRELFDYYQRLMQVLVLVGDELAANGIGGVNSRYPWMAGNYNCTDHRGYIRGADGESKLAVELTGRKKTPFPQNWNALRDAIVYSQRNYGDFDDWWLVDGSSFNLHPFIITGWYPWLHLNEQQFYGPDFGALADLIHEPMHDVSSYGIGHNHGGKEIVPMETTFYGWPTGVCSSDYGPALNQIYWFMMNTSDDQGVSLWKKLTDWAGPKPIRPMKPAILN